MRNTLWTEDEDKLVREHYEHSRTRDMISYLPDRSPAAIQKRARFLGLNKISFYSRFTERDTLRTPAPIGTTRKDANGYILIKIGFRDWRFLHRYVWEQHHGKPTGSICFKDGNRSNCDISNLYLSSPAKQLEANSMHNLPEELRKIVKMRSTLNYMINNRSKRK